MTSWKTNHEGRFVSPIEKKKVDFPVCHVSLPGVDFYGKWIFQGDKKDQLNANQLIDNLIGVLRPTLLSKQ